ncbi:MAG: ABC transporter permease [Treponema sp.]|jgi:ABC-2 type transport system permease protein|nr:ABC transporter permease [Treponema sp.]
MKPVLQKARALARKELYSYSISPAAYGIAIFFLLFTSIWLFYFQQFLVQDTASLRAYFAAFPLAFIAVIPGITMKSWAEERKTGTVELLLTMPFSDLDLALGKFLSSFGVLAIILALTLPVPLSLLPLGSFDTGVIVTEYLGALLLGASATALGLFLSALSKNQVAAFLGSAAVLLVVMLANQLAFAGSLPGWLTAVINFVSLAYHFESFAQGLLDSRDVAFFLLTTGLFLFLNTRVILFRKWR